MNPIEVILINDESLILKILGSPIFPFIAGSTLTIVLTVLMQKRNELQLNRDKILEIRKGMNDIFDCLNTLLYYLNPEANISLDVLIDDKRYASEKEFLKAIDDNKKRKISETIDATQDKKRKYFQLLNYMFLVKIEFTLLNYSIVLIKYGMNLLKYPS